MEEFTYGELKRLIQLAASVSDGAMVMDDHDRLVPLTSLTDTQSAVMKLTNEITSRPEFADDATFNQGTPGGTP